MVIVINVSNWKKKQKEGIDIYIKELLLKLFSQQKDHQFYLLFDDVIDNTLILPSNVTTLAVHTGKSLLTQKYWTDIKLPMLLKKTGANVYLGLGAIGSLRTKVPQCILFQDLSFLDSNKQDKSKLPTSDNKYWSRFLHIAKSVMVPSAFLQQELEKQHGLPKEKVNVITCAIPKEFGPVSYELKESLKALYAHSQEYFVYKGLIHTDYNLVNLLKAFSIFKKRQQSSWKLVLAGVYKEGKNDFLSLLETYKFKEDVFVTGPLSTIEQAEVLGSAYAMVTPALSEKVDIAIWEAMQCGVPVLAANTGINKEIGKESLLYFDGNDPADMADKLMEIYKDENGRRRLIVSGTQLAGALSWDDAVHSLWEGVLLAAKD